MNIPLLASKPRYARQADALFNAFTARVTTDGGIVSNPLLIRRFYREMAKVPGAIAFLQSHGIVLFPEARRMNGANVDKMYSLFNSAYDVAQTTAGNQPVMGASRNGKLTIDYQSGRRFEFSGATALGFFNGSGHASMGGFLNAGFSGARNFVWYSSDPGVISYRIRSENSMSARRELSGGTSALSLPETQNIRWLRALADFQGGNNFLFRDGGQVATSVRPDTGVCNITAIDFFIGSRNGGNDPLNGAAGIVHLWKATPPAGFLTAFNRFILTEYNLPA
jgi:hypothetical protein